jgi:putative endonuclease
MYFVYIIKNSYGNLYIGVTDNPERRLYEHNTKRGSDFTKVRDRFQIVFLEEQESLTKARKREIQIKKWRRDKKEKLIDLFNKGISTKLSK